MTTLLGQKRPWSGDLNCAKKRTSALRTTAPTDQHEVTIQRMTVQKLAKNQTSNVSVVNRITRAIDA
jgi:hypothetical protein